MLDPAQAEVADQVHLVLAEGLGAAAALQRALDVDRRERRRRRYPGGDHLRLHIAPAAPVARVADLVAERQVGRDVVLEARRSNLDVGLQEVAGEAVEVVARHRRRRAAEVGQPVVRQVVLGLMEIAQHHPGVGPQPVGEAGCHAPASGKHLVAVGVALAVPHSVDAEGGAVAELRHRAAHVDRATDQVVGAAGDLAALQRAQRRRPGDLVDGAAGRAAPEQDRRRPFQHLDRVKVERIARVAAEVAHAVEVHVVARIEAAQRQVGALPARFAGPDRDARGVAEDIAERGRHPVFHHLARGDVDHLRGVDDRLGQLHDRGRVGLVALRRLALDQHALDGLRRLFHGLLGVRGTGVEQQQRRGDRAGEERQSQRLLIRGVAGHKSPSRLGFPVSGKAGGWAGHRPLYLAVQDAPAGGRPARTHDASVIALTRRTRAQDRRRARWRNRWVSWMARWR